MNYKQYGKEFIGASDGASLILAGGGGELGGLNLKELCFGGDGVYDAYIVDKDAEIGNHYYPVALFTHFLKIYDDDSLARTFKAKYIKVYRAAEMGCIIQLINE